MLDGGGPAGGFGPGNTGRGGGATPPGPRADAGGGPVGGGSTGSGGGITYPLTVDPSLRCLESAGAADAKR